MQLAQWCNGCWGVCHEVSLPNKCIFVFYYVDLALLLMLHLHFRVPSQIKGWWRTYSEKSLWCQRCTVESLDCTTWQFTVREMTGYTRSDPTPRCGFDAVFTSRRGWFTISHRRLATFISSVYYCCSSGKAVWEYSGHSFHKLNQTVQSRWFAAYFSR